MPSIYNCLQVRSYGKAPIILVQYDARVKIAAVPQVTQVFATCIVRRVFKVLLSWRWQMEVPVREGTVAHGAPQCPFERLLGVAKITMEQVRVGVAPASRMLL